jgi:hypothetical protein
VLYVLCWLAAVLFPNFNLTHAWLELYSTAPAGSVRGLVEGAPPEDEVRVCLEANKDKVSPGCKTALETAGGGRDRN